MEPPRSAARAVAEALARPGGQRRLEVWVIIHTGDPIAPRRRYWWAAHRRDPAFPDDLEGGPDVRETLTSSGPRDFPTRDAARAHAAWKLEVPSWLLDLGVPQVSIHWIEDRD